jgi:hypothetical protein
MPLYNKSEKTGRENLARHALSSLRFTRRLWRAMASSLFPIGRFLVADLAIGYLAIGGQFIPASAVWACGKTCCSASASQSCCKNFPSTEQDLDSACPLCATQRTDQRHAPPCHCHLKARHNSATTAKGRAALDLQAQDQAAVVRLTDDSAGASAELTRLALAAGDTIPYRPPRIVYGVWRN